MTVLRANLFMVALGLSLLGLVMVYSATYREVGAHYLFVRAAHVAAGVVVFLLARRVRYTAWRRYAPPLYFVVLASLVLVLIPGIGTERGGARRWFDLGVFGLQPAEFAKIAAVLVLSAAASRLRPGSGLPVRPLLAVGILCALVLLQPDFDTVVVLVIGVAAVLWASEVRTSALLLASGAAGAALAGVMLLAPYRRDRLATFLDPTSDPEGSGYQIVQSMIAIRSGGFFGAGAGAGGEAGAIPEVQTDMIFALVGAELGLVGMVAVIGAFTFLAVAGLGISLAAPTVMARCVAAGLTTMIGAQALLNIGAAMNLLPLTGMPLPFVSYGGSNLLASFAAVGVLYRISEDSERAREARPRPRPKKRRRKPAGADRRRRNRRPRDSRPLRSR